MATPLLFIGGCQGPMTSSGSEGGPGALAGAGNPAHGGTSAGGPETGGAAAGGVTSSGGVPAFAGTPGTGGALASGGLGSSDGLGGSSGAGLGGGDGGGGTTSPVRPDGNEPGSITQQGDIVFSSTGGWLEYGFAEWKALASATAYHVYCKSGNAAETDYAPVPPELVRATRVDLPGLRGNESYDLKVVPVVGAAEATDRASVVRIKTKPHDRSGFAFDKRSPRGAAGTSGGYLPDGTLDPAAQVLYVTDANKDAIQLAVTKGNNTTTFTGLVAIQAGRTSAKATTPLVIRFIGVVTPPAGLDALKMMQLKDNGNVTYEGIGTDAQLDGWGLDFQRCTNVEIRNLSFKGQPEDQLSFQSDCLNLWVHNVDHFLGKGLPDADADKLYGDGPLDVKSGSSWVSVAYNFYHATKKSNGVGFGDDTTTLVMTYHHNFYDACGSRMPRISYVSMHVYNTYFKDAQVYTIAAAHGCSAFVQNNYFENCKRPMIIASQGHDLNGADSTLSHNPGGTIKAVGNFMDAFTANPQQFDPAVDASPGPALSGGAVYNDFDLDFASGYPQRLESPEEAKATVLTYAGHLR